MPIPKHLGEAISMDIVSLPEAKDLEGNIVDGALRDGRPT
jgi:hypothetical protein